VIPYSELVQVIPAEQTQLLRALPTELKPRSRVKWLPSMTPVGPQPHLWELRPPAWHTLRGMHDCYVAQTPLQVIGNWMLEVEDQHRNTFAVLLYRSRREFYQMRSMLLHAGRP
jgi:hypothetical protein